MQTSSAGDAVDWQQPRGGSQKQQHSHNNYFDNEQHYLGSQPQVHSDDESNMSGSISSNVGEDDEFGPQQQFDESQVEHECPFAGNHAFHPIASPKQRAKLVTKLLSPNVATKKVLAKKDKQLNNMQNQLTQLQKQLASLQEAKPSAETKVAETPLKRW